MTAEPLRLTLAAPSLGGDYLGGGIFTLAGFFRGELTTDGARSLARPPARRLNNHASKFVIRGSNFRTPPRRHGEVGLQPGR